MKILLKLYWKLCKKLKESTIKIINCEEKEIIQLTYEESKSYIEQEACHIWEKKVLYG